MVLPFVTVSVWNYCNQRCSYCVSESQEWNYKGRFEIFRPKGCDGLNDHDIKRRYGADYYKEMCDDDTLLNAEDVMDVDYLAAWLGTWRKNAVVHITGGEPLLRPDIESFVERIATTHKVVLYTNGSLIKQRKRLLDLPLFWHVTYHRRQINLVRFRDNIAAIQDKPHRICSVLFRSHKKERDRLEKVFEGYDFEPIWVFDPRQQKGRPTAADLVSPAATLFNIITPCGTVWTCNKRLSPLGSIYTNTFDEERARAYDETVRKCLERGNCSAFKTQVCIEEMAEKWGYFDSLRSRLDKTTSGRSRTRVSVIPRPSIWAAPNRKGR